MGRVTVTVTLLATVTVLACPQGAAASSWVVGVAPAAIGVARSQLVTAPTGATATCTAPATTKTVTVTWTTVPHATYTVMQSSTSATTGYAVVAAGLTSASWTSGALKQNNTYWFEVSATLGGAWTSGASAPTAGTTIHPKAPFCT